MGDSKTFAQSCNFILDCFTVDAKYSKTPADLIAQSIYISAKMLWKLKATKLNDFESLYHQHIHKCIKSLDTSYSAKEILKLVQAVLINLIQKKSKAAISKHRQSCKMFYTI